MKIYNLLPTLLVAFLPLTTQAKDVWILVDGDATQTIKTLQLNKNQLSNITPSNGKLVTQINEDNIFELSELMHEEHKRCGGFTVHNSMEDAVEASKQPIHQAIFSMPTELGQAEKVNYALPLLSADKITNTISSMSDFTNRYYRTSHGELAANWLTTEWATMADGISWASASAREHSDWRQDSVKLTLTGSTKPNEIVIIGGHLDSINGVTGETKRAPGADDNASGIATITEVIRVFLETGNQPERTIKFMAYAAEEVGLLGSKEIAATAKSNGDNIIAVMQLDMTGFIGGEEDIVLMNDYTDSNLNSFLELLMNTYQSDINYAYDRCGYACSDHASWHAQGYPASMPFEAKFNDYNPDIHSSRDTLDKLDATMEHALNFAKLAMSYTIELGFPVNDPTPPSVPVLENNVPVTGLAGNSNNEKHYKFIVPEEAQQAKVEIRGSNGDADLYVKKGTTPTRSNYDCRPYTIGSNETCLFDAQPAGDYFVMVRGYRDYSNLTLKASYGSGGVSGSETNLSGAIRSWSYYQITVPEGTIDLNVSVSDGAGDVDLYLRKARKPQKLRFDCYSQASSNDKQCSIDSPGADIWYIGLYGKSDFSDVNLNWNYK